MALSFEQAKRAPQDVAARHHTQRPGLVYAWSGFAIMWAFWVSFVVFLAQPSQLLPYWPLPTIDHGGAIGHPLGAALIDLLLIALFGLQHSLMARPWFKKWWAASIPPAFERCTYVHMANLALFALIIFWQPIPAMLWDVPRGFLREVLWTLFACGWIILFFGARSFGILDLLGIQQMRSWCKSGERRHPRLKTGLLYRWLRHPMYVGVLLGIWATPRMSLGHALLALGARHPSVAPHRAAFRSRNVGRRSALGNDAFSPIPSATSRSFAGSANSSENRSLSSSASIKTLRSFSRRSVRGNARMSRPSRARRSKHHTHRLRWLLRSARKSGSIAIAGDQFAIDRGFWEIKACIAQGRKPTCHVDAAPRVEPDALTVSMDLKPPAVELHLMQPFRADRRLLKETTRSISK